MLLRQMRLVDDALARAEATRPDAPQALRQRLDTFKFQLASFAIEDMYLDDTQVQTFAALLVADASVEEMLAQASAMLRP